MVNILVSIAGILITIFLVVGIHELGHFTVAKLSGIKVLRFAIGFGKPIVKWQDKKGTEYVIAMIPLGGYVKMLDEGEGNVLPEEAHLAYNRQPFYKKIAVIAAGPLSNFIFAFLIYWFLFVIGFITIAPLIGSIAPHSIAAVASVPPQQEIIQIDNKPTPNWTTVIINMIARAGDKSKMDLLLIDPKTQEKKKYSLPLSNWHMDELKPDPLESLGITAYEPVIPAEIGKIQANGPAAKAGLKTGDKILKIGKEPVNDWIKIVEIISIHPSETIQFSIERDKKIITVPITIGYKNDLTFKKHGYMGMSPNFTWPKEMLRLNKYPPLEAAAHAWQELAVFTHLNFIILGKMVTGKISLQSLGGPITIFESAGTALNHGFVAFLSFLAFLSISIGVINIIPIPGLDGGHLLFQTIEAVIGRPLSQGSQVLFYRLGFIFLIMIMVQAFINDILRL